MVRGLDVFRKYFEQYPNSYVIIGGTACDMIIGEAGFTPRATKDIDIILVVEALSSDFVKQFWQFIKDGNYERKEKSSDKRKYYRFIKPSNTDFPYQVELFSRNPDLIDLEAEAHLTPIPVNDDLSSLSAILLEDGYYRYIIEHCTLESGLQRANTEALICLKAKAFLDLTERKSKGEQIDDRNIKKHKADVFRLAVFLADNDIFDLEENIKKDLQNFTNAISKDLPDRSIFKEMGLGNTSSEKVLQQLLTSFKLN